MSNAKWTKGVWRAVETRVLAGKFTIKHHWPNIAQPQEMEANAHLIASAPDLYKALDACLGLLTGNMDGDLPEDCNRAEMARQALAKARGE